MIGRLVGDESAAAGIDASLPESVESDRAFDPRKAVIVRSRYGAIGMRVAAVKAWFWTVIAFADDGFRQNTASEPEITLRWTACENDMGELLDFGSQCLIGPFTDAGRAIRFATGDSHYDIFLRPSALCKNFAELVEGDLELFATTSEGRGLVSLSRFDFLAETYQIVTAATVAVFMGFKR